MPVRRPLARFAFPSLALTGALVAAALAPAQEPRPATTITAPPTKPDKAPFVFEAGDLALDQLITRCANYLQRNILFEENDLMRQGGGGRKPRGGAAAAESAPQMLTVSLQQPVVTDRDGCEDLLSGFLWSFGLTIVPIDEGKGVYEVISLTGQRAREVSMRAVQRTPAQVLARPTQRQWVTVVYTLQHTNAMIATNALRPFFSSNSGNGSPVLVLGNLGNSAAIVLTGPQDQVASALTLLQRGDVAETPEAVPELAARVEALAKQNEALQRRLAELEQKLGAAGNR
jgi:hypothetical protein